jgi:hypothetical protein
MPIHSFHLNSTLTISIIVYRLRNKNEHLGAAAAVKEKDPIREEKRLPGPEGASGKETRADQRQSGKHQERVY